MTRLTLHIPRGTTLEQFKRDMERFAEALPRVKESLGKPMAVFVLTSGFDYEGEAPVGVYASQELAKAVAEQKVDGCWPGAEWLELPTGGIEYRFGSSHYIVRKEEIIGE